MHTLQTLAGHTPRTHRARLLKTGVLCLLFRGKRVTLYFHLDQPVPRSGDHASDSRSLGAVGSHNRI